MESRETIVGEFTTSGSVTKNFTIENTGTIDAYAKVNFKDLINTYTSGSLVYSLEESTDGGNSYSTIVNNKFVPVVNSFNYILNYESEENYTTEENRQMLIMQLWFHGFIWPSDDRNTVFIKNGASFNESDYYQDEENPTEEEVNVFYSDFFEECKRLGYIEGNSLEDYHLTETTKNQFIVSSAYQIEYLGYLKLVTVDDNNIITVKNGASFDLNDYFQDIDNPTNEEQIAIVTDIFDELTRLEYFEKDNDIYTMTEEMKTLINTYSSTTDELYYQLLNDGMVSENNNIVTVKDGASFNWNDYSSGEDAYSAIYKECERLGYITKKSTSEPKKIKDGLLIPANEKHYYKLTISYNYLDNIDQTNDKNAEFSTSLTIEEENEIENNYLMTNKADNYVFGNTNYTRNQINNIYTVDNTNVPANAIALWDISESQDGSVMAWITNENTEYNSYNNLYIGQEGGVVANKVSSYLFSEYKLTTLDLSNFDISKVTNMDNIFECSNIENLITDDEILIDAYNEQSVTFCR